MTSIHDQKLDIPYLGGTTAAALFVVTLVAFVAESQLTQVSLPPLSPSSVLKCPSMYRQP